MVTLMHNLIITFICDYTNILTNELMLLHVGIVLGEGEG